MSISSVSSASISSMALQQKPRTPAPAPKEVQASSEEAGESASAKVGESEASEGGFRAVG